MDNGTVRIEELRIRVPGLSTAECHALGEEVARVLSEASFEDVRHREVGALDLKVRIPAHTPRGDIARIVGRHILEALR